VEFVQSAHKCVDRVDVPCQRVDLVTQGAIFLLQPGNLSPQVGGRVHPVAPQGEWERVKGRDQSSTAVGRGQTRVCQAGAALLGAVSMKPPRLNVAAPYVMVCRGRPNDAVDA